MMNDLTTTTSLDFHINNDNSDIIKEFRYAFLEKYLENNRVGRKSKSTSSCLGRTRTSSFSSSFSKSLNDNRHGLSSSFSSSIRCNSKPYLLKKSTSIDMGVSSSNINNDSNKVMYETINENSGTEHNLINSTTFDEFLLTSSSSSYQENEFLNFSDSSHSYNTNYNWPSSVQNHHLFTNFNLNENKQELSTSEINFIKNNDLMLVERNENTNQNYVHKHSLIGNNKMDELLKTFEDDIKIFSFELESIILN